MNAVAVEVQPTTTTTYQVRSRVPIPPRGCSNGRPLKNPALIAAVDSMGVGDCLSLRDRSEAAMATMRIKKLYGNGCTSQRQHEDGTYTIWSVK